MASSSITLSSVFSLSLFAIFELISSPSSKLFLLLLYKIGEGVSIIKEFVGPRERFFLGGGVGTSLGGRYCANSLLYNRMAQLIYDPEYKLMFNDLTHFLTCFTSTDVPSIRSGLRLLAVTTKAAR